MLSGIAKIFVDPSRLYETIEWCCHTWTSVNRHRGRFGLRFIAIILTFVNFFQPGKIPLVGVTSLRNKVTVVLWIPIAVTANTLADEKFFKILMLSKNIVTTPRTRHFDRVWKYEKKHVFFHLEKTFFSLKKK